MRRIKNSLYDLWLSIKWDAKDLYYWWRNYIFNRYDLVRTGLDKGSWHDIDQKMLYANMEMLVSYVEKEDALNFIVWDKTKEECHVKNEIIEIYNWWKDYPNKVKHVEEALNDDNDRCWIEEDNELDREATEMLIRLVKIRNYLWT